MSILKNIANQNQMYTFTTLSNGNIKGNIKGNNQMYKNVTLSNVIQLLTIKPINYVTV